MDLEQRQRVEIVKVLMMSKTRLLIFDDPTSVLTYNEVNGTVHQSLQSAGSVRPCDTLANGVDFPLGVTLFALSDEEGTAESAAKTILS